MKASCCLLAVLTFAIVTEGALVSSSPNIGTPDLTKPSSYIIGERGANHQGWYKIDISTNSSGETIIVTNKAYEELATGLNYFDPVTRQWTPSKEEIIAAPGGAVASQGQHKVRFPTDIFSGVIRMDQPGGGKVFLSQVVGLSYSDGHDSVLIATVTNSIGQILPSGNEIIYTNCFSGINASLRYTYRKDSFEQDVLLESQLPSPTAVGLSQAAYLEVVTEFIDPPAPAVRRLELSSTESDTDLDFGLMKMGRGRAFIVSNTKDTGVPVKKEWEKINGRQFLFEQVPLPAVLSDINSLPAPKQSSANSKPTFLRTAQGGGRMPATRLAQVSTNIIRMAKVTIVPGTVVLDYTTLNTSQTNKVFQGDMTYYLSGNVSLFGTNTTFEGGTVIKYASNVTLTVKTPVTWLGGSYRPVVLISKNDNSVGESISGANNDTTNYAAATALYFDATTAGTNLVLQNLRVGQAQTAVAISGLGGHVLSHVQLVNCVNGLALTNAEVAVRNALMARVLTNFSGSSSTGRVEHLTSDKASQINANVDVSLFITNSLFVLATNVSSFTGANCSTSSAVTGIFTNVGAGSYYLVSGSPYRNAGTTNISAALLADLKKLTTYPPPFVLSNMVLGTINSSNLTPQVQRDMDWPDLGYHYDPLDYLLSQISYGPPLSLSNGVAIGLFGTYGFLPTSAGLNSLGRPDAMNRLAWYPAVQEQPTRIGNVSVVNSALFSAGSSSIPKVITLNFTDTSMQGFSQKFFDLCFIHQLPWVTIKDCWLRGVDLTISPIYTTPPFGQVPSITLQNNLLERGKINLFSGYVFDPGGGVVQVPLTVALYNNLFWSNNVSLTYRASLDTVHAGWTIKDNLYDGVANSFSGDGSYSSYIAISNDAFYNTSNPLGGSGHVTLTNLAYATAALGRWYIGTAAPSIWDVGSRSAPTAGLYHHTTLTNQTKEANSTVDIGFHYVAVDGNGNPIDTDGDGVPDYLEDANGNGLDGSGESPWTLGIVSQPQSTNVVQGQNATFSVSAGGIGPFTYQWKSNGVSLAGANGSSYTRLVVTNEAVYSVVVSNTTAKVTSSNAQLYVTTPLALVTGPASQTLVQGTNASFTVTVSGNYLTYKWSANGVALNNSTHIAGATSSTVTVSNILGSDAGTYSVVVSNLFGTVNASASLIVITNPWVSSPPTNTTAIQSDDVALSVAASGFALNYQWWFTNSLVTNSIPGATNSTYAKLVVQTNDAGHYSVVITNLAGKTNANADLTVLVPPWIVQQPVDVITNQGSNATFTVSAIGTTNLIYQWFKNRTNAIADATNSSFTLTNVQAVDAAGYSVLVTNVAGTNFSAWAWLSVILSGGGGTTNGWGSGGSGTPTNAPFVIMISPTNTSASNPAVYLYGPPISIRASAWSTYNYVTNVAFYAGTNAASCTNLLGSAVPGPNTRFALAWTNSVPGTNTLKARAWDNLGNTNDSTVVYVIMDIAPVIIPDPGRTLVWEGYNTNVWLTNYVSDDGLPYGVTNISWIIPAGVSVSHTYTYTSSNIVITTLATFTNSGNYGLQLQVSDGFASNSATCWVNIRHRPTVSFNSPTNTARIALGPIVLSATATSQSSAIANVKFYNTTNFTLIGTAIQSVNNTYTFLWQNEPAWTNLVSAVATDNDGLTSTSSISVVIVPPLDVSFVSPTNNQLFVVSPTNILLSAWPTSYVGSVVTSVTFSNQTQGIYIGSGTAMTNSTYQFLWPAVTNGVYTVVVTARDYVGNTATNAVAITVNATPAVSIITPTNIQTFREVTNVTLTASAYDLEDGTNLAVGFYYTNSFIGWATNIPGTNCYTFLWTNRHADTYPIVAVATDSRGASTPSALGVFKVTPTNPPPFVQITYPTNNAIFAPGSDITITAIAYGTNGSGSVTNVEFFVNGESIGSDSDAPYEMRRCCWKPGNYVLVARANDTFGSSAVSTNINIVVTQDLPTGEGFWDATFGQTVYPLSVPLESIPHAVAIGPDNTILVGNLRRLFHIDPSWSLQVVYNQSSGSFFGNCTVLTKDGTNIYAAPTAADAEEIGDQGNLIRLTWGYTNWVALGDKLGNGVEIGSIAILGGDLYVAGTFTYSGSFDPDYVDTNVQYVAKLDVTNNRWLPVGTNNPLNGAVNALAVMGGHLFAGGTFTSAGENSNVCYVAELIGNTWTNLGAGISNVPAPRAWNYGHTYGGVQALAVCGTNLFVGGHFFTAGGNLSARGVAVWNTREWKTLDGGVQEYSCGGDCASDGFPQVNALAVRGDRVYVGGNFDNIYAGSELIPAFNVAAVTWSEGNQIWTWSDLDGGVQLSYEEQEPPYLFGSKFVTSLTIRNGTNANQYDVVVSGYFYAAGQSGNVSPGYALWRVGYPQPPHMPQVTITSLMTPVALTNPAVIFLGGIAISGYTNIQSANFYTDGMQIGSQTFSDLDTNQFMFTNRWDNPLPGVYLIKAMAIDDTGLVGESRPLVISIKSTGNSINGADDQFRIPQGSPAAILKVLTNDTPSTGLKVTQVIQPQSNLGRVTIGHDGTYLNYTPLPNVFGTDIFYYAITNSAGAADSASVTVKILANPVVEITAPYDAQRFAYSSPTIWVTNTARDYDGSITNVLLLTNGVPYKPCAPNAGANFVTNWTATAAGFYTLQAAATDNDGLSTTSSPVTVVFTNSTASPHLPVAAITNLVPTIYTYVGRSSTNPPVIRDGLLNLMGKASDSDVGDLVSYAILLLRPEDEDNTASDDPNFILYNTPVYADVTPGPYNPQHFHIGGDSSGDLGVLDLTGVPNGTYDLVLRVRGGTDETNAVVRVTLDSQLKIGQFSFSEQDLVLPVSGIPLSVTRTYNSLNPLSGAFGQSWTYALNDMDVQVDEERTTVTALDTVDEDPELPPSAPFDFNLRTGGGRDVTLTLPDGRRTTFYFTLVPSTFHDDSGWAYDAKWIAPPGVTYTLTTPNPTTLLGFGDNTLLVPLPPMKPFWKMARGLTPPPMDAYDFPTLVLSNRDGTRYEITRDTPGSTLPTYIYEDKDGIFGNSYQMYTIQPHPGKPHLSRIIERSGDIIQIQDDGIFHYTNSSALNPNRSVLFDKDAAGRITAIRDPNSGSNGLPTVKYVYNRDTGNLIQVHKLTDRAAGTYTVTKYHYDNPKFLNYITSIEDPRGVPIARNEYDDSGKLVAVVDADGKRTEFIHSTTNKMEVTTDRAGNKSTYVYDTRGNVTWITNALTEVSRFNYDDNGNKIAETNAFGTTSMTWMLSTYDEFGNQTHSVDSLNRTNSFAYDSYGNLLSQMDPLGNTTTNGYDAAGNLTITVQLDAQGNVVEKSSSVYSNGQLIQTLNANNQVTASFGFDSSGNLTSTTDSRNFTRNFGYDLDGYQTNSSYVWVDPNGGSHLISTTTIYDAQGRVTQTIDADGNTNNTFYNGLGKVDYTIDRFGNTNSFIYDARGNLIQTTYPDGLVTHTVFDAAGRPYLTTDRNGVTGTLTDYDALGRATNVYRLTNVVVSLQTAGSGLWTTVTNAGWVVVSTNSTEYLLNGWVKSRTGPDRKTTTYAYWPDGQIMYVTNALNQYTYYEYDSAGRQKLVADALSRTNKFEYDAIGRMVKTTFADNSYVTNIFNGLGQRVGVKDQAGLLTQFGYDTSGQLTNVIKPPVLETNGSSWVSPAWSYTYDQYGRLSVTTDPLGRTNTSNYDALGRQITQRLPMTQTNFAVYNTKGQLWKQYDFKGQRTEFVYDKFGRIKAKFLFQTNAINPDEAICYRYNQLGQLDQIADRFGADASTNACDGYATLVGFPKFEIGFGEKLMASLNGSPRISGTFMAVAMLALAFACVPRGKRRCIVLELRRAWRVQARIFAFTEKRNLCIRRRWMPAYGWRTISVVTAFVLLAGDPHWNNFMVAHAACDIPSNASTATTRITQFAYDLDGRLTQVNSPEGVINYVYDLAVGRLTSTCTTNSYLSYTYDELGRLKTVNVSKRNGQTVNETTTYNYDEVGNRKSVQLPNNIITDYAYDSLNRLTNLVHRLGTTATNAIYRYKLDGTGRRTNAVEVLFQEGWYQTNTLTWQYDGMYRLTNEVSVTTSTNGTYAYTNAYQFDKAGNRLKKTRTGSGAETITSTYNDNDQLSQEVSSVNPTTTYLYDANGSLTNKTQGSTVNGYTYNVANKLSGVYSGSTLVASYLYNDQGLRVQTTAGTTTHYLIDANNHTGYAQVLEELATLGGTASMSYVIGDEVLAQCGTTVSAPNYFLPDGHGNNRQLSRTDGTVANHYNYDTDGTVQSSISSSTAEGAATSKLYCGEQYDSNLHMYNLRARYYSPSSGRFNQRDTFGGNSEDPQSVHKYAYANGDPVNGMDPTGQFTLMELQVVLAILVVLSTVYLVSHGPAYNKAKARSATNSGREAILFGIDQGQIPKKGEWLSMSSEDRDNMVNFWTSTGERLKQIQMVQDGNTIGAYHLAEAVNYGASAADFGLNSVVSMAHTVPFIPNPWGKMGDPITQATTAAVKRDFMAGGFEVTEQVKFEKGALGIKDRYVDIFAKHKVTDEKFIVQIGKMRKDGVPVSRERWAWDDIIFSPTIGKPEYKGSKFLFIEKGATGLPLGWNQ
jgi:RHS repeat-associated protein